MRVLIISLLVLAGLTGPVRSDSPEQVLRLLSEPRTHAIMRHALAPGFSDPSNFDVTDCATQRNLNDAGREQARATGEAFRRADASVDAVWTSQWCRCIDTADLLDLGDPKQVPALNSFFENRGARGAQTEATRAQVLALPPETNVMMVTHQVNISALIGRATTSGEVIVFKMNEDGSVDELGSFVLPAR